MLPIAALQSFLLDLLDRAPVATRAVVRAPDPRVRSAAAASTFSNRTAVESKCSSWEFVEAQYPSEPGDCKLLGRKLTELSVDLKQASLGTSIGS